MIGEHDSEPVPGLPAHLPAGERMLWQGAPATWALARNAFHVRAVGLYFAALAAWQVGDALAAGSAIDAAAGAALIPLALGTAAVGILLLIAWLMARTTRYTLTSRRVVFRIGVALPMTVNVPFRVIDAASLKLGAAGSGDIALETRAGERVSYLLMWPHVRPWRFARPQATLRAVPGAAGVAERVSAALAQFTHEEQAGAQQQPAPAPRAQPARRTAHAGGASAPLAAAS